ncbi:MAG: polysaccharide deacetylase family protein [Thermoanaerobaculales bacterium]|nr:polysaccharide deacetylase family protein [Thermoanaerobaculales bacterium]
MRTKTAATSPLDPVWTIALVTTMAVLLLAGVGRLVGELVEVSGLVSDIQSGRTPEKIHRVTLVENRDGWEAVVKGVPNTCVLVIDSSNRSQIVTLDAHGTGRASGPVPEGSGFRLEVSEFSNIATKRIPVPVPEPTSKPATPTIQSKQTEEDKPRSTSERSRIVPTPQRTAPPLRPAPKGPTPPILHLVTDSGPYLALTFDGGASNHRTAELLDLLQKLDIETTLFLTGEFIETQPGLVRRAVLSGHEVGNHTFTHPHLTTYGEDRTHRTLPGVTKEMLLEELRRTEEVFQRATGRPMVPLWRAPFGEENSALRRWAYEAGYLHVRWSSLGGRSLDTLDWVNDEHSSLYRNSQEIVNRLLAFPQLRGGIALMHLSTDRTEAPWLHLPEFIDTLEKRNLEPVKVTRLLEKSRIWKKWLEGARKRHSAQQNHQQGEAETTGG